MDAFLLAVSLALPWCSGCALLRAGGWLRAGAPYAPEPGGIAITLGYGYFLGLLLLTGWMRLLSATGIGFGRGSIAAPFAAVAIVAAIYLARRHRFSAARMRAVTMSILQPPLPRWQRIVWLVLLAWLAFRWATLAVEIDARPLYPWDAWTQWATKARVWYAAGRILPFVPSDVWLADGSGAYFDASPSNPATVPLLQVWTAIALDRWDDSAINWPWLLMLVALALAVYGTLRAVALPPLGALLGAYLVSSLPLLDTQVALAGCADLMLCAVYTLAALALHRWASFRSARDGLLALLLAAACLVIKNSGVLWALTLVPGVVAALWPRRGPTLVAWMFGAALLAILILAQPIPIAGPGLRLEYAPQWRSLMDAYLVLGNWNLLWYVAAVLAVLGARRLALPPLAPLAMVAGTALAWIVFASMFRNNVAGWFPDAFVINRMTLQVAPLVAVLCVLVWRALDGSPTGQGREWHDATVPATATDA